MDINQDELLVGGGVSLQEELETAEKAARAVIRDKYRYRQRELSQWRAEMEKKVDPADEKSMDEVQEQWRQKYLQNERDERKELRALGPQSYFVILDEHDRLLEEFSGITAVERDGLLAMHLRHQHSSGYIYAGKKVKYCTDLDDPPQVHVRADWLEGYL